MKTFFRQIKPLSVSIVVIILAASLCFGEEIIILGNNYKIPKIYEEDGVPKGILIDIVHYLDNQLSESHFKIKLYPWARAYKNAVEGEGGIIGLSKNHERLKLFDYSDVVYYDEVIIVVIKGSEFQYTTIEDLKGKTIGIGRGGSFGDDFERYKQMGFYHVREDNGPSYRLMHLLNKTIDAALVSPGLTALFKVIQQNKILTDNKEKFVVLPKAFKSDPNYLGFSKKLGMKEFLGKFNKALENGYKNGEIKKIISIYQ